MKHKLLTIISKQPSGQIYSDDFPYADTEIYHDHFFHQVEEISPFHKSEPDLMKVIAAYKETAEGKALLETAPDQITWGYALEQIPAELFEAHGFYHIDNHQPFSHVTSSEVLEVKRDQVLA